VNEFVAPKNLTIKVRTFRRKFPPPSSRHKRKPRLEKSDKDTSIGRVRTGALSKPIAIRAIKNIWSLKLIFS
jgi:hypothetical protein